MQSPDSFLPTTECGVGRHEVKGPGSLNGREGGHGLFWISKKPGMVLEFVLARDQRIFFKLLRFQGFCYISLAFSKYISLLSSLVGPSKKASRTELQYFVFPPRFHLSHKCMWAVPAKKCHKFAMLCALAKISARLVSSGTMNFLCV